MRYRAEIDGLRAVAVVPVLLYHGGFTACAGGFVGVDVFFVISGYLITSLIAGEIRSGSFSIARFYERRARRILPALLTVSIACVPFAWIWMSPSQYDDFSKSLVAVAVFASNVYFERTTGYFAAAAELKPLLHTWSLAVEEQFYLAFPLLLLAVRRFPAGVTIAVIGAVSTLSLGVSVHDTGTDRSAFYLIPARAWELGVGAMLALGSSTPGRREAWLSKFAPGAGLALVALAVAGFDDATPFPGWRALVPVLGTALVIRYAGEGDPVGRLLRWPVLVRVGLLSYSLYLWHHPILAFLRLRSLHEPSSVAVLVALGISLALAALTWKFIEVPARRRDAVPVRRLAVACVAAGMALVAVGLAGYVADGFPDASAKRQRADDIERRLRVNSGLGPCNEFPIAPACRTSEEPEIMVWGDSFAMHLVEAILASNPDARLIQFTRAGCGPVLDLVPVGRKGVAAARRCEAFNRQVEDWVRSNPTLKYAVVSSLYSHYTDGVQPFWTGERVVDSDVELAVERFVATLDFLAGQGIRPVVVSQPPTPGSDVGRCLFRSRMFGHESDACDFPRERYERELSGTIRFLREIEERHAVIWLDRAMCDDQTCATADGETLYYVDYGHLTREGAADIGRRIGLYERLVGVDRAPGEEYLE